MSTNDIRFITIADHFPPLDVLLMEIRSTTLSYTSMKKKKTAEEEEQELEEDIKKLEQKIDKNEL